MSAIHRADEAEAETEEATSMPIILNNYSYCAAKYVSLALGISLLFIEFNVWTLNLYKKYKKYRKYLKTN